MQTSRGENGSFCRYQSTVYVSLCKTKEIKRQETKQLQIKTPSDSKYKAFRYLQMYAGERVESCEPLWTTTGFSLTFEVEGHWLVSSQVLCKSEGQRPQPLGGSGGMLSRKILRT